MAASDAVVLRRLRTSDLTAWYALQHDSLPDPYTFEGLERELRLAMTLATGLFDDGTLVAAALGWVVVDELQILTIVVARDARLRGHGARLCRDLLARAAARGARSATLEVRASNVAARTLYARLGFVQDGLRRSYYPDGEDAVLMRHDDLEAAMPRSGDGVER